LRSSNVFVDEGASILFLGGEKGGT